MMASQKLTNCCVAAIALAASTYVSTPHCSTIARLAFGAFCLAIDIDAFLRKHPQWQSRLFRFYVCESISGALLISKRHVFSAGISFPDPVSRRNVHDFSRVSPSRILPDSLDLLEGLDYIDAPTICPRIEAQLTRVKEELRAR
jgi:hypothetical protein